VLGTASSDAVLPQIMKKLERMGALRTGMLAPSQWLCLERHRLSQPDRDAQMIETSHHVALPIHRFWPLRTQVSPSRFAVVVIPPLVPDPTSGSVRQTATIGRSGLRLSPQCLSM
jgi:hypothetical protein